LGSCIISGYIIQVEVDVEAFPDFNGISVVQFVSITTTRGIVQGGIGQNIHYLRKKAGGEE
jgi:hypothetical protein